MSWVRAECSRKQRKERKGREEGVGKEGLMEMRGGREKEER